MSVQCPDCGAYLPPPGASTIGNPHKQGCRNSRARPEWRDGKLTVPREYNDYLTRRKG